MSLGKSLRNTNPMRVRKLLIIIILLTISFLNVPRLTKPITAAEFNYTWHAYCDLNSNGQMESEERQGDFSIYLSAPDSAQPSSHISVHFTFTYLDNEFARAHDFTFSSIVVSLRKTPAGANIVSAASSYTWFMFHKGESLSDTVDFTTPSENGVYYIVITFHETLTGGGAVTGTWYADIDTGLDFPQFLPTIENKFPSQLSLELGKSSVVYGESVTLSGTLSPGKSTTVTIEFSTDGGTSWQTLQSLVTQSNGFYSYEWTPSGVGEYLLRSRWLGDDMYASATSQTCELIVSRTPTQISCALSSETVIHVFSHGAVTISGEITPSVSDATVQIYYRSGGEWVELTSVKTDAGGKYSYSWLPPSVGKYDVKVSWQGDASHEGAESSTMSVSIVDYTLLTVIPVVAAVGVAALYFLRIRKKPPKVPSTPQALTCPHCGAQITLGAEYCPDCGKKVK